MLRRGTSASYSCVARNLCSKSQPETIENASKFAVNRDGDSGQTKLLSGQALPKSHKIFHAIGHTEELNAHIGMARVFARENNHSYTEHLKRIQTVLIDIQTLLSKQSTTTKVEFAGHVNELEDWMEAYGQQIQPIESYLLPGGSHAACCLQIARTVCRKTERGLCALPQDYAPNAEVQAYINRLADFLLILSRIATKLDEQSESIYIPKPDSSS